MLYIYIFSSIWIRIMNYMQFTVPILWGIMTLLLAYYDGMQLSSSSSTFWLVIRCDPIANNNTCLCNLTCLHCKCFWKICMYYNYIEYDTNGIPFFLSYKHLQTNACFKVLRHLYLNIIHRYNCRWVGVFSVFFFFFLLLLPQLQSTRWFAKHCIYSLYNKTCY